MPPSPPSPAVVADLSRTRAGIFPRLERLAGEIVGDPVPWNRTTCLALLALVCLWGMGMYKTWAHWGDLTIDCGREMYVPAALAHGKMLYRDVYYPYTPGAAYLNSYLFQMFGEHLEVLYWAGSLSALGCSLLLYLSGMQLSSWIAGWTAGAIVLMQAFEPFIFNFPLPYAYGSVYGCVAGCLFLWFAIYAANRRSWMWVFGGGSAAALALLFKPEMGTACYATLALLIGWRGVQFRSWKTFVQDVLATLPGLAVCGMVIRWMISIAGPAFITQENIMSWPTSYFMRTYGKQWLDSTGLTIDAAALAHGAVRILLMGLVALGFSRLLRRAQPGSWRPYAGAGMLVAALAVLVKWLPAWADVTFRRFFLPREMVILIAIAALAAWWFVWKTRARVNVGVLAIVLTFSSMFGLRILLGMRASGYPVYYNGPAILCFLLLTPAVFRRAEERRAFLPAQLLVCFACLVAVAVEVGNFPRHSDLMRFTTERGTIRVLTPIAENYRYAVNFMKDEAARGEFVLSVPEDTSLYFLSGTECPTRVYAFTPGTLAPGKMTDEQIQQMEEKRPKYLLWSNRTFSEYGVPVFGRDFDRPFGDYLRSHYRFVGPVGPRRGAWNAGIWERIPQDVTPASDPQIPAQRMRLSSQLRPNLPPLPR